MYKFKFDPPQEHRRSLQQSKSEHIAIYNILDKCTQILRDDKLWLRNQIKSNNNQVLDIFKQFPRSSQFANLQVKLRKYVQTVKGRIKQQQLNKFKETLANHHNPSFMVEHNNHERKLIDRNLQRKRTNQSSSKSNLKTNNSVELNKTTTLKMGRSQDHFEPNKMQMSSSLRHFQQLIKHKYNQDIIEERQSQNVTSARLGRQENQTSQVTPLNQQNFSSIQNKTLGKTGSHFLAKKDNFFYDFKNKAEANNSISREKQNQRRWSFEKKAKQALYAYREQQQKEKEIQEITVGISKVNLEEWNNMDDRDESIFDKHFTESEKASAKNDYSEVNSINNVNDFKNVHVNNKADQFEYQEKHQNKNDVNSFNVFHLVESNFSSVNSNEPKAMPKPINQIETDRKSDENLFTPMDLLNECRNFLKNRENSMKKSVFSNNLSQTIRKDDLKESAICNNKMEESIECLFSRNNFKESSYLKEKSQEQKKQEQSIFSYPQIKDQKIDHKAETGKQLEAPDFHYQSFETFANSDTKKHIEKALTPPQFGVVMKMPQKQVAPNIPKNFTIEGFLEEIMQITEMQPFISSNSLSEYINFSHHKSFLNYTFSSFIKNNNEICLTTLAQAINKIYYTQNTKDYPHSDKTVNSVYDLLDIEPKGFITRQDIESFLSQIEQAQVQNYDQVEQQLMRLFEGADFTNEQRLTYWHLYLVKNSEQFQRVSQLLSEFQFQIERQN